MCPSEKSTTKTSTDVEIKADQQEVVSGLVPDYTYAISVAAVNRAGKGRIAGENRTTLEEGTLILYVSIVKDVTQDFNKVMRKAIEIH